MKVPTTVESHVRTAVHAYWRETALTRSRQRRRRRTLVAAAATLAAAAFGLAQWPSIRAGAGPVASVATVTGAVWRTGGGARQDLALRTTILAGDEIVTGEDGLAAFAVGEVSVRLDRSTRLVWHSRRALSLQSGGVYVDGAGHGDAPEIRTPFGVVREIGTQFEVRLVAGGVRLRVREGRVRLDRTDGSWEAKAGEELAWSVGHGPRRASVAVHGSAWDWPLQAAPPFTRRPTLDAILEWMERETGWTVRFAEEATRAHGSDVLYGTLQDVRPDQVPERVLPAFGLDSRMEDGVLVLWEE